MSCLRRTAGQRSRCTSGQRHRRTSRRPLGCCTECWGLFGRLLLTPTAMQRSRSARRQSGRFAAGRRLRWATGGRVRRTTGQRGRRYGRGPGRNSTGRVCRHGNRRGAPRGTSRRGRRGGSRGGHGNVVGHAELHRSRRRTRRPGRADPHGARGRRWPGRGGRHRCGSRGLHPHPDRLDRLLQPGHTQGPPGGFHVPVLAVQPDVQERPGIVALPQQVHRPAGGDDHVVEPVRPGRDRSGGPCELHDGRAVGSRRRPELGDDHPPTAVHRVCRPGTRRPEQAGEHGPERVDLERTRGERVDGGTHTSPCRDAPEQLRSTHSAAPRMDRPAVFSALAGVTSRIRIGAGAAALQPCFSHSPCAQVSRSLNPGVTRPSDLDAVRTSFPITLRWSPRPPQTSAVARKDGRTIGRSRHPATPPSDRPRRTPSRAPAGDAAAAVTASGRTRECGLVAAPTGPATASRRARRPPRPRAHGRHSRRRRSRAGTPRLPAAAPVGSPW
jgi:hypothetical protein